MNKVLSQIIIFLVLFFGTWFLLSRINFTGTVDFKKISKENEQRISKMITDYLKQTNDTVANDSIIKVVKQITNRICIYNKIDTAKINLLIFKNSEVNAFALPANNLAIYSGIISFSEKPEELAGVIAHEIAHIEIQHIVKKLTKEVGLAVLISVAGGDAGGGTIKEIVRTVSSTAFDRKMESEADKMAVEYMAKANIDPENLATMMMRLANKTDLPGGLVWVSTHPDSKERASEILKLRKTKKFKVRPLLNDSIWNSCKRMVKELN
jgi:predicted Zn-dependent protease